MNVLELILDTVIAVSALGALGAAIFALRYTAKQTSAIQTQLEQTSIQFEQTTKQMNDQLQQTTELSLAGISFQHNWTLFDRYDELPPAHPAWRGLSPEGWAWRVLHLNHLNLLQLAYQAREKNLISENDLNGWVLKMKYLFSHLWEENPDEEILEGRKVLIQLLWREEGYPKPFRDWLVDEEIIPSNDPDDIMPSNNSQVND